MTVKIYGKDGCGNCEQAKKNLREMGVKYEEHHLAYHIAHHDNWRSDDSVKLMAAHTWFDSLPLIQINDKITDYSDAMRILRMRKNTPAQSVQYAKSEAPAQMVCDDNSCKLTRGELAAV